jgi:ribosomal protein S18 acetylase RimI-like enzyme
MINFSDSISSVSPENLNGFFVDWPNPPGPETHLRILHNSTVVILAQESTTGQVVGFINAISDGILSAYIPLLEVLPAYQGRGIGKELLRRMLEKLQNLYMVDVLCDAEMQSFYAAAGMQPGIGMMLRNYGRQSGE